MGADATTILSVPVSDLTPTPENSLVYRPPETASEFDDLITDIRQNGIHHALIGSADGYVLSGHRRLAAARDIGLTRVPVQYSDILVGPMTQQERLRVLTSYNAGTREKTAGEKLREAVAIVDPEQAVRDAERRRANHVCDKTQTFPERVKATGSSRRTDPAKQRRELFEAAYAVLHDLHEADLLPVSVRHVHYKLLRSAPRTSSGKRGHPYGRHKDDCAKLSKLLTDARSAGLVPEGWITDETRPREILPAQTFPDFVRTEIDNLFGRYFSDIHRCQPRHVEIVVEKNTVFRLLADKVGHKLRLPIQAGRGYCSYPVTADIAERFRESGKAELAIVYVSDLDPEGVNMPEAFQKYFEVDHGITPTTIRAAVTPKHVQDLDLLPDADAKVSSSRYGAFTAAYGHDCYELDSMPADALVEAVKSTCMDVLDADVLNEAFEAERVADVTLAQYRAAIVNFVQQAGIVEDLNLLGGPDQ